MPARSSTQKTPKLIRTCSIWRALEVIGDTPILLILEAIWWGERRFDQIQARSGQQRALVSNRLKKLIEADILKKRLYTQTPPRYEYVLTAKGMDLYWVALMLLRWEQTWSALRKDLGPELTHKACGSVARPEPFCGYCKQPIHPSDVDWEEGPGVGMMAPVYSRRRRQRLDEGALTMVFRTMPFQLYQLVVIDGSGQPTELTLENVQSGRTLNDELFKFRRSLLKTR